MNALKADYVLVADGACKGNPGPGGFGLIVVHPKEQGADADRIVREYGGNESNTTNNRMELMGFYRGLQVAYAHSKKHAFQFKKIHFITDSKYVIDGASKSVAIWAEKGWETSAGSAVKNQDLWEKILKGLTLIKDAKMKIDYELVKGHAGHEANERVDKIAVAYSKNEAIDLFHGVLGEYSVGFDRPEPYDVQYLSFVSGRLQRHSTWDECKSAIEGKSNAKYKKVKSLSEERLTLKAWGVSG